MSEFQPTVTTRRATAYDDAFVDDLAREDAEARLALLPEPLRRDLVDLQVRARRSGYAADWPDAVDHVVEQDGRAVGRLLLAARDGTVHIVDVRLRADACGRGIGSALLRGLVADAGARGEAITLRAEPGGPAHALYRRLGFVESPTDDDVVGVLMTHQPSEGSV